MQIEGLKAVVSGLELKRLVGDKIKQLRTELIMKNGDSATLTPPTDSEQYQINQLTSELSFMSFLYNHLKDDGIYLLDEYDFSQITLDDPKAESQ